MSSQDEDEPGEEVKPKEAKKKSAPVTNGNGNGKTKTPTKTRDSVGARGVQTKTRGGKREQVEQTTAEKIKANQARLREQRQQDGLSKWAEDAGGKEKGQEKVAKRYESYRREEQLPRQVEDRRVSFQRYRSCLY